MFPKRKSVIRGILGRLILRGLSESRNRYPSLAYGYGGLVDWRRQS